MKILKVLNDALIISYIRLLAIRRSILSYAVIALLLPIGITLMISSATGITEDTKINYLVGTIVFSLSLLGINGIGQEIAQDILLGTLKWFIVSPIHPLSYIIGILIPHAVAGLVNSFIILMMGKYVLGASFVLSPILLLIFVLCVLSFLGIGAVIGSRAKTTSLAYGLTNAISFIIVLISPVYYTIDLLPPLLRPIAYIIPTTHAAQALRTALSGSFDCIPENLLALGLIAAILLIIGVSNIKWRET